MASIFLLTSGEHFLAKSLLIDRFVLTGRPTKKIDSRTLDHLFNKISKLEEFFSFAGRSYSNNLY